MKPGEVPWRQSELLTLEAMRMDRKTCREIAVVLKRRVNQVRWKVTQLGLIRPPALLDWLPLLSVPRQRSELARRLGVSVAAVKLAKWRLVQLGYQFIDLRTRGGRRCAGR
jgi:hypothetical protein